MAETTVLKSSASPKATAPQGANAFVEKSGPMPKVNVTMGSGGKPQVQGKDSLSGKPNVQIFPPKGRLAAAGQAPGQGQALTGAIVAAQRGTLPPVIVDHRGGQPRVHNAVAVSRAPQVATPVVVHAAAPGFSKDQLGLLRFLTSGFLAEQGDSETDANHRELALGALDAIDLALAAPEPATAAPRPPMRRVVSAAPTSKISAAAAPRRSVVQDQHVPAAPVVVDPASAVSAADLGGDDHAERAERADEGAQI